MVRVLLGPKNINIKNHAPIHLLGAEARQGLLNDIGIWIGRVRSIYKTKDEEEKERKRSRAGKYYTPRS